jgi:hypothetical protein
VMPPDPLLLAYLAGLLDADGFFTIRRDTRGMRVRGDCRCPTFAERIGIKQVTTAGIELLHTLFPGCRHIEMTAKGKPMYAWEVVDAKAAHVAEALLPYLRIKRRQAELILLLREHKNLGRKALRVPDGTTYSFRHWTGRIVQFPRMIMSQEAIQYRHELFEEIKSLNDIRPQQPKLG